MKKIILVLVLFLISVSLFACAPKGASKPVTQVPVTEAKQVAKGGWEAQWEQVRKDGAREGKLVIYATTGQTVFAPLVRAMHDKFGITLEVVSGRGTEITAKFNTERKNGLFLADIFSGGSGTVLTGLRPEGTVGPLDAQLFLPEVIDKNAWYGGDLPWVEDKHLVLSFLSYPSFPLSINTNVLKKDEVKAYKDLLNPKFKGKITWNDPTVPGPGSRFFMTLGEVIMGYDFLKELAKQEIVISRDERLQVDWLAQGKNPIALGAATEVMSEYVKAGAPISYVSAAEGTHLSSGSGSVAFINNAPHPNAARTFVNFLLTKEGQALFQAAYDAQTARVDVPAGTIPQERLRQPGMKYFNMEKEVYLLKEPQVRLIAKDILIPK